MKGQWNMKWKLGYLRDQFPLCLSANESSTGQRLATMLRLVPVSAMRSKCWAGVPTMTFAKGVKCSCYVVTTYKKEVE